MENGKIKVLEVLHGLAHGGIESFVMSITENIDTDKFMVDYALATDFPQFHEDRVRADGNRIFKTKNLGSIKDNWLHFIRLVKLIRKEKYDVVHTHVDFFNGVNLLAAWLGGAKIRICHSHAAGSANGMSETEGILTKSYHFFMKILIYIFSTEKIGCSSAANLWMYGSQKNTKVIYNAINLKEFSRNRYNRQCCIEEYNINTDFTQFGTVGRIVESKNPLFIAEVINEYSKINSKFHFHWISDGRLKNQVEDILKIGGNLDKVTFWGVRNDVPKLLSVMDYFIFPSLWEGLGIATVEAQAMGLMCFVSEQIPKEADLGGLKYLDLSLGSKKWAEIINKSVSNGIQASINTQKLQKYDVCNMIKEIEKIYIGK